MSMNAVEAELKAQFGHCVIFEDREIIDPESVEVRTVKCRAMDHMLRPHCENPAIYQITGMVKGDYKGARSKQFETCLCEDHLAAWCKLHGLDKASVTQ